MLGLAPDVRIIDLGHDIPAHNVRAGALLLVRAVQYLPDDSIVVAVVDPGVGTDRRLIGVEVAGGVLLGPDNGLLAPAVALAGGARTVVSLENTEYHLPAPGPDVLGPRHPRAGGRLPRRRRAAGRAREPTVDPAGLVPGLVGLPETGDGGAIVGEVWWVDRFGNCQLNIDPAELAAARASPAAASRSSSAGGSGPPGGCTPTPTPSRRSWCCSSTPTACSASPSTGSRPRPRSACTPGSAVTLVPEGATLERARIRSGTVRPGDHHRARHPARCSSSVPRRRPVRPQPAVP